MVYTIKSREYIRILLISQDENLSQTLSQELPQWEINISTIGELKNIYQKVKKESPNIILLDGDIKLDEAEMFSIIKLKRLKGTSAIIVCIGDHIIRSFKKLFEKIRRMRNIYFISKPVLATSLIGLIEDILIREKDTVLHKKEFLTSERRKSVRAMVNLSACCQFLKKTEKPPVFCQIGAQVKNISPEGMLLEIKKPISIPKDIDLEFSLFSQQPTIMVRGQVKWRHTENPPYQQYIGLKFKNLSSRAQNLIIQHVYASIISKLH